MKNGDPSMSQKEPPGGIRAKPNFDVEVKKGNQTLVFSCSFFPTKWKVSRGFRRRFLSLRPVHELLGGSGISNEVHIQVSELCTNYEHYLYIELMVNLQKFLKEEV
ncbi:hypothetical protein Ocin01_18601 [Orchesella cincta]|uniref:Uncharacterized protein n=1 Tax=Orchesella cincta TaxID=48709 RepID=A0A1D2M530_ORCCI|nr:hypothetical protein Ocin01_18601 [Orchesella cincta]